MQRCRPTPETEKIKITTHHAVIEFGEVNEELFEDYILRDSCFALVSNGPQERITDSEILKEYKKQWKIENKFQFMKTENLLEPIRLHRANRIKAMLFIQWLAVLVASYLSHRLNKSLQLIEERKASKMNNYSSKSLDIKENSLSSNITASPMPKKQIDTSQQKEVSPRTTEPTTKKDVSPETTATPMQYQRELDKP